MGFVDFTIYRKAVITLLCERFAPKAALEKVDWTKDEYTFLVETPNGMDIWTIQPYDYYLVASDCMNEGKKFMYDDPDCFEKVMAYMTTS